MRILVFVAVALLSAAVSPLTVPQSSASADGLSVSLTVHRRGWHDPRPVGPDFRPRPDPEQRTPHAGPVYWPVCEGDVADYFVKLSVSDPGGVLGRDWTLDHHQLRVASAPVTIEEHQRLSGREGAAFLDGWALNPDPSIRFTQSARQTPPAWWGRASHTLFVPFRAVSLEDAAGANGVAKAVHRVEIVGVGGVSRGTFYAPAWFRKIDRTYNVDAGVCSDGSGGVRPRPQLPDVSSVPAVIVHRHYSPHTRRSWADWKRANAGSTAVPSGGGDGGIVWPACEGSTGVKGSVQWSLSAPARAGTVTIEAYGFDPRFVDRVWSGHRNPSDSISLPSWRERFHMAAGAVNYITVQAGADSDSVPSTVRFDHYWLPDDSPQGTAPVLFDRVHVRELDSTQHNKSDAYAKCKADVPSWGGGG